MINVFTVVIAVIVIWILSYRLNKKNVSFEELEDRYNILQKNYLDVKKSEESLTLELEITSKKLCKKQNKIYELSAGKTELQLDLQNRQKKINDICQKYSDLQFTFEKLRTSVETEITDEFRDVEKAIKSKKRFIFVTGGAGCGKTTLIKWLASKNLVDYAVAPTGVAAQNCNGSTIHSFFCINPNIPVLTENNYDTINPREENRKMLATMNVLVIDEISMVRADLLDAIIHVCNRFNNHLQYLLVGDPFQLPPILEKDEQNYFDISKPEHKWDSYWFFDARNIKDLETIHLTKTFRQNDSNFIKCLNEVRVYSNIDHCIDFFNEHCRIGYNQFAATLTGRRKDAELKNNEELNKLSGARYTSKGIVTGTMGKSRDRLPAPYSLSLKYNALVMLLINDPGRKFVNGTLGLVKNIDCVKNTVSVELQDGSLVLVNRHTWRKTKRLKNINTGNFEEVEIGSFTQYPLMLAWAVTIHKSQGKTLSAIQVNLPDSFAPGQVYVALSRTRNVEDITLNMPLRTGMIISDKYLLQKMFKLTNYINVA